MSDVERLMIDQQIAMYEEFLLDADKTLFKLYQAKDDIEQGSKTT